MNGRTKKEINGAIERFLMRNPFPCLEGRGSLSKKSPGEFERAAALSFSIIFGDTRLRTVRAKGAPGVPKLRSAPQAP